MKKSGRIIFDFGQINQNQRLAIKTVKDPVPISVDTDTGKAYILV